MQVSLTIPEGVKDRVINALCARYGYDDPVQLPDGSTGPRPETKAQFSKAVILDFIKRTVKDYEGEMAYVAAKTAAESKADAEISLA